MHVRQLLNWVADRFVAAAWLIVGLGLWLLSRKTRKPDFHQQVVDYVEGVRNGTRQRLTRQEHDLWVARLQQDIQDAGAMFQIIWMMRLSALLEALQKIEPQFTRRSA